MGISRGKVYSACNSRIWDLMFRGFVDGSKGLMEYMDEFTEEEVHHFVSGDAYDDVWQEVKLTVAIGERGDGFGSAIYDSLGGTGAWERI